MNTKRCGHCKQIKTIAAFNRSKQTKDGYKNWCRECQKTDYQKNRTQILKQKTEYNKRNQARIRQYKRRHYEKHREEILTKQHERYVEHKDKLNAKRRERYAIDREYQERVKAQAYAWRSANYEKHLQSVRNHYWAHRKENQEYRRGYARKNRAKLRKANRQHYLANREDRLKYAAQWRRENPDKRRRYSAKRRALKNGHNIKCETISGQAIIIRDRATCWICGKNSLLGPEIHLDHVIPLSKGGSHTPDNIRVACATCNCRKQARLPGELQHLTPPPSLASC